MFVRHFLLFMIMPVLAAASVSQTSAQNMSSSLGAATQMCLLDGIGRGDISKHWFRRALELGGDGQRHYGLKVRCEGDQARALWVEAGRVEVAETGFKSDQNNMGTVRYLGGATSYCIHLDRAANGDPMNGFICFLGIDLDPELVTAL